MKKESMVRPIEISASILSADFANLGEEVKKSQAAGVDRFHIDCMDGHFVPNLTIGPIIISAIRPLTNLPLEAHLMIEHPGDYIESYAKAGADIIQIQVECYGKRKAASMAWNQWPKEVEIIDVASLKKDLQRIKAFGKKAHVVFNPSTPMLPDILTDCDGVLIMSVNPGFAGQKFMPQVLTKVEYLRDHFKGDIGIDGGINDQTAPSAIKAGAFVLITASYLYGAQNMPTAIKTLKSL